MISKTSYKINKPKIGRKTRSEVYHPLLLYINRSIAKKFPIETLLEMIDSSIKTLGESESIISKSISIGNFFVLDLFLYSGNRGNPHLTFFGRT